jgi:hypothetical protein
MLQDLETEFPIWRLRRLKTLSGGHGSPFGIRKSLVEGGC